MLSVLEKIHNYYSENSILTESESLRLGREREGSLKNSKTLESNNEDVNEKSKERHKRSIEITNERESLEEITKNQSEKLGKTKSEAENTINSASISLNQQFQSYLEKYKDSLNNKVGKEVQKIEKTLQDMQESNKQLIDKVKESISGLPDRIFTQGN